MSINLEGVSETLLITLCAKAYESKREDAIIKDLKSEEIIEKIDYDFSKLKKKQANQIGTAIRTKIIDDIVKDIIKTSKNGDSNIFTIINLGAGLDTRAIRFIDDNVYWFDIDFDNVIKLRKTFFSELENNKNYKTISSSILDFNWIKYIKNIENMGTVIIIAEGVLMYLEEKDVKELIENLAKNFSNSHFIFDIIPTFFARHTKLHSSVKETNAIFKWGLDKPYDIEKLNERIKFVNSYNYGNYFKKRWGLKRLAMHIPFFNNIFNFNTLHIRLS